MVALVSPAVAILSVEQFYGLAQDHGAMVHRTTAYKAEPTYRCRMPKQTAP